MHESVVAPRFGHIAGDRFLDLVNTVDWRRSDELRSDRLRSFSDVVDWCGESDLISPSEALALRSAADADAVAAHLQLTRTVQAREWTYQALFLDDSAAAASMGQAAAEVATRSELALGEHGWAWRERDPAGLATPADRIIRGLLELGKRNDLDRLHQCEDAKCGWVYLDTSPRRNRRWCATSDCGDRNRSRAYYARKKAKP